MIKYDRSLEEFTCEHHAASFGPGLKILLKGSFIAPDGQRTLASNLALIHTAYMNRSLDEEVRQWNGMYSIAIMDTARKELTWIQDRFGYDHHFYAHNEGEFQITADFFASSRVSDNPQWNEDSSIEFLRYRFITADATLRTDVRLLAPASITRFRFSKGEISQKVNTYFRFEHRPFQHTLDENASAYHQVLKTVIKEQLESRSAKLGLTLTGGADSRYLFALLQGKVEYNSYTFGAEKSEDMRIARQIAGTSTSAHHKAYLDQDISSFFNLEHIDRLLLDVGHSCFYYQAYGMSKLMDMCPADGHLLTGVDGCWIGLNAKSPYMDGSMSHDALRLSLQSEHSAYMSAEVVSRLTGISSQHQDEVLKSRLEASLWEGENSFSSYLDWLFKNKARRYISAYYSAMRAKCAVSYPFDDYRLIDLTLQMPAAHLEQQNVYVKSLLEYGLTGEMEPLKKIPFEQMAVKSFGQDSWVLERQHPPLINRVLNKFHPQIDSRQSHPISQYIKNNWKEFIQQIHIILESSESTCIDSAELLNLLGEMRRKDYLFFHKQLSSILSLMRMSAVLR